MVITNTGCCAICISSFASATETHLFYQQFVLFASVLTTGYITVIIEKH